VTTTQTPQDANEATIGAVASTAGLGRFATCINCGYAISWLANQQLRYVVDCPECRAKNQFGPGVFVDGFHGCTAAEVVRQRADKRPNVEVSSGVEEPDKSAAGSPSARP